MSPFRQIQIEILLRAIFPGRLPHVDASTIAKGAVRAMDVLLLMAHMPQDAETTEAVFEPLFREAVEARRSQERHLEA